MEPNSFVHLEGFKRHEKKEKTKEKEKAMLGVLTHPFQCVQASVGNDDGVSSYGKTQQDRERSQRAKK